MPSKLRSVWDTDMALRLTGTLGGHRTVPIAAVRAGLLLSDPVRKLLL